MEGYEEALRRQGFCIRRSVVPEATVADLERAVAEADLGAGARRRRGAVFGVRNLLSAVPAVRRLAASGAVRRLVEPILGPGAFAVRGILFDKTREANWQLRWHQDKAIPLKERHDVPGFGPWSVKAGVPHAYPPAGVLEGMLTVRLHLDACDASHGALWVLPGSHREGLLPRDELDRLLAAGTPVVCAAGRGDAVVMRPLLAHASGRCERPGHRRVVHLELANEPLPPPLEWHERVALNPPSPPPRA